MWDCLPSVGSNLRAEAYPDCGWALFPVLCRSSPSHTPSGLSELLGTDPEFSESLAPAVCGPAEAGLGEPEAEMEKQGRLPLLTFFPQVSRVPAACSHCSCWTAASPPQSWGCGTVWALCSAPLLAHPWVGSCWPGVGEPPSACPAHLLPSPSLCPLTCPVSPSGSHCPS